MKQLCENSRSLVASILTLAAVCTSPIAARAQTPPASSDGSKVLAWDADTKEANPKPNEPVARFTFSVTNLTDQEIIIKDAKPSCGCTEATLPSKPWHLAAHSNGVINVGVNLAGKSGTLFKWVDVFYASNATKRLNLKVVLPEAPGVARTRNQEMAKADRQAVFKGDCAKCHIPEKNKDGSDKMGKDLYAATCGVCHEATPRATMVPDLHALNHSTDLIYWKVWISGGKPGTLMPAFSKKEGGPLTDEQIDSLAEVMLKSFPPNVKSAAVTTPGQALPGVSQKN